MRSAGEGGLLRLDQFSCTARRHVEQSEMLVTGEGIVFRGGLHLDKIPGAGHDNVHIDIGAGIFLLPGSLAGG